MTRAAGISPEPVLFINLDHTGGRALKTTTVLKLISTDLQTSKGCQSFHRRKMFAGFMNALKVEQVRVADQGDVTLAKK